MTQMKSKVEIYNKIYKLYDSSTDDIIEGKITLEEFKDIVIDVGAFDSCSDIIMFLIEKIFDECKEFDGQFPIKYYATDEEFDEDELGATEDDLEHLTDEYVQTLH